jgi:hypothetical protein
MLSVVAPMQTYHVFAFTTQNIKYFAYYKVTVKDTQPAA